MPQNFQNLIANKNIMISELKYESDGKNRVILNSIPEMKKPHALGNF